MGNLPRAEEAHPVLLKWDFRSPLPGYHVISQFYDGIETAVYRAIRISDRFPVVLKCLKPGYADALNLARYSNAYKFARSIQSESVLKVYGLESHEGSAILVLENVHGIPLSEKISEWHQPGVKAFPLREVVELAGAMVDALISIHDAGIIHKDLRPASVVLLPVAGKIRITNFDFATNMSRSIPQTKNPRALEGTLAYLSPEQTGRMNRKVDFRADIYSLGVTFYEMLSGRLPFDALDAIEIIHAHIAKTPVAPHLINSAVPEAVSRIVFKMMAKAPEDRYQSARGLRYDLKICARYLESHGRIPIFSLGLSDKSDCFLVPEKIYGRSAELESFIAAFDRAANGKCETVLISGPAGIGKTAVANEIHGAVVHRAGFFVRGKFNQLKHDVPFSGFVEALRDLMQQLLGRDSSELGQWKNRIGATLGNSGKVLVDLMPELALIIGPQPAVSELSGTAAQNRFNLLFQKFVASLPVLRHPIVMFLDDLEWADASSLDFLQLLIREKSIGNLLILGAYRDSEIGSEHHLNSVLREIRQSGSIYGTMELGPLPKSDVNQLIADALSCSLEMASPLTDLVYRITQGNPLFNNELVRALYSEGLINFDSKAGFWKCDISKASALSLSDDILEFMAVRISRLAPATRELLKLAACIGNTFDLDTLVLGNLSSKAEVAEALQKAVDAGIILPQDPSPDCVGGSRSIEDAVPSLFGFLHERVRRAAYSLIPNDQKQIVHLQIARKLLHSTPVGEIEDKIFAILHQANQAIELITDVRERKILAELNFRAGQKAKAGIAYRAAWDYFIAAHKLMPDDCWTGEYKFMIALYEALIESACLTGEFLALDDLAATAYEKTRSPLDRIRIFEIQCQALAAQGRFGECIGFAFEILKSLGADYSQEPKTEDINAALEEARNAYADRQISDLIDLPLMTDQNKLAIARILNAVSAATFFVAPDLFTYLALKDATLSMRFGNTPNSPFAYATYGQILCRESAGAADIESGYQFGQLALKLVQKLGVSEMHCKVHSIVQSFVTHWKDHIKNTLDPLRASYQVGLESGDFQFAAYAALLSCLFPYAAGVAKNIQELCAESEVFSDSVNQMNQPLVVRYFNILRQALNDLINERDLNGYLKGDYFDETKDLTWHLQIKDWIGIFYIYFQKVISSCTFGEWSRALEAAEQARRYIDYVRDFPYLPMFCLYESLAHISVWRGSRKEDIEKMLPLVDANQARMKVWAQHASMNCRHKFDLVEAERHRILGEEAKAADFYVRAIDGARANGYFREEALASELAGSFFLDLGKTQVAHTYLAEARSCYERWGAKAKVRQLEQKYRLLLNPTVNVERKSSSIPREYRTELDGSAERMSNTFLDMATVVKASQAISSEIELAPLLKHLMRIVMENAGAQRGALIMERDGKLMIEAQCDIEEGEIAVLGSKELQKSGIVSAAVVSRVAETYESVLLNDAAAEGDFARDRYIMQQRTKSVICAPLVNQGRLSGIVYLENNLTTHAFTADRLELLYLLSAQMALSLDNARLYQRAQEEISERKLVESALRESELRSRTIFNSVNEAIIVHEMHSGKIFDVNKTACDMYGYTRDEMLHLVVEDLSANLAPFTRAEAVEYGRSAEREGLARIFEWKARDKSGRIFWVEVSTKTALIGGKNRVLVVVRDITKRKTAEEALKEKTEELDRYFESSLDMLCIADMGGRFIRLNPEWEKVLGYTLDELRGRPFLELVHPEDKEATFQASSRLAAQNEVLGFINRYVCKDGSYRWLEWNSYPSGDLIYAVARDITDRKRVEAALQRSESVLRATIESISDGLLIVTQSGRIQYSNTRFFDIWSIPPKLRSVTEDQALLEYVLPQVEDPEKFKECISEIYRTRASNQDHVHFKDGRVIERFSFPLERSSDESALVWIFRDITERIHAMDEIRRMNEKLEKRVAERTAALEQANRELESFSYSVSHDLRAPLRAIEGFARILTDEYAPSLDSEGKRVCGVIQSQTQKMSILIDELLEFSRLSRASMHIVEIDMKKLVRTVFSELTGTAERKRISFRVAELPPAIGDTTLLRQTWVNLISNALKFSGEKPRAIIRVGFSQDAKETIYSVSDNGAGFEMRYYDKLFSVFQRLHSDREFQGTGVGLAIVHRAILRHGGRVWAQGEVGKGATFYFSLPGQGGNHESY